MARQDILSRLQGQDPNRRDLKRKLQQIGNYNQSHQHGDPIGDFNASHVAGQPMPQLVPGAQTRGGQVPATRDHALDPTQAGWNRQNAPVGPVPAWVARQMAAQIPPGVVPTKPVEAVQGSDSLTGLTPATVNPNAPYPVRRPAPRLMPPPNPRPRRGGITRG